MWREEGVLVRVPASTANLGPGFDTLGMALQLHLWVSMKPADQAIIRLHGSDLEGVPTDESNLIYRIAQKVFDEAGIDRRPIEMEVYSEIPLTRGLGSSASAIIGGLVAANQLIGEPLDAGRLYDMATAIERHPDNVGASLIGGIVAAAWDGEHTTYARVEPDRYLSTVVAIPQFQLETKQARGVLPSQVDMAKAVFNISRSSLLVAALSSGRYDILSEAMKDCLHQPYRAPMIPGMTHILEHAVQHGALGVALSGAGPTLLAFIDKRSDSQELISFMRDTFSEHRIDVVVKELEPSHEGAVCIGTWSDMESILSARMLE